MIYQLYDNQAYAEKFILGGVNERIFAEST